MSYYHEGRGVSGDEFQSIKQERIMERRNKAEERRHQDLQRIRDMKSKCGVEPLDHFPKLVWDLILKFLNPTDLKNVCEVHPSFQELLEFRRIRDILFPLILGLKFTPVWKEEGGTAPVELAQFAKLREVSKSLRDTIDKWHEDEITRNLRTKGQADIQSLVFVFPGDMQDRLKLDGVLANFSNGASRFFLRSLKVKIVGYPVTSDDELESLRDAFMQFTYKLVSLLEMIGEQVWRFELDITETDILSVNRDIPMSEIYRVLIRWMVLTPNLKWIVVKNETEGSERHVPRDGYRGTPFTHLEHLERVCCAIDTFNNANIFHILQSILKANQHVKALNVTSGIEQRSGLFFKGRLGPLLRVLPLNLQMFSIDAEEEYDQSFTCPIFIIQPIIKLNWNLKSLHLEGVCRLIDFEWKSFFRFLENFQALENLSLRMMDIQKFRNDFPFLNLPNLTHLKLKVMYRSPARDDRMEFVPATNFFFALQFLLYVKKLKKLEWKLTSRDAMHELEGILLSRECKERGIDFRAGMWDLSSSNLWDCFPELEFVEVEIERFYNGDRKITKYRRRNLIECISLTGGE